MPETKEILEGFHTIVAGITRHGKSYYVKKTLIPLLQEFKPVIVFDRKLEYAGKTAVDASKKWIPFQGIDDFFNSLKKIGYLDNEVYVIQTFSDRDYIAGLNFFEQLKAPVSIILDEAHDIFLDPDFYQAKTSLIKLVRYGAGHGIDTIMVTQRTMDIPPNIRSQFNSAISFKQTHEDDRKVLDKMGFKDVDEVLKLDKQKYKIFGKEEFPDHINLS